MAAWTRAACPKDGRRLVLVTATNADGDAIKRWECPAADWAGPWYAGDDSGDSEALPEVSRRVLSTQSLGASGGGAGVDPVSIKDGTVAAQKLAVDATGKIGVNNFPASQPVTGPLTDAQLRAVAVPVSGTVTATGPLTDAQLRAAAVPVSGTVSTGGLTDAQLRATAVPVSGPLTDTQLRATPVPVSGTVTATGPLTDAQLRASAVPVSLAANQSINLVQLGGVAVATGSGASSTGTQRVIEAGPAAADILVGHLAHTATTAAATVITVPINRTWRGTITVTCDVANTFGVVAAGQALGTITTTGASAVPAAGTIITCEARVGAGTTNNLRGGEDSNSITIPITISAGATALATVALASTIAGTNGRVACIASGVLI